MRMISAIMLLLLIVAAAVCQEFETLFVDAVAVPAFKEHTESAQFGTLKFEFSKPYENTYRFTQHVHSTFNLQQKNRTQEILGTALLIVRTNGMGTGEIELKDWAVKSPSMPAHMEMPKLPPIVIKELQEDGKSANINNPMANLVPWLLPMTGAEIELGASVTLPRTFPLMVQNQSSEAVGSRIIHAKQHIDYEGTPCLLFTISDTLDKIVPPIGDTSFMMTGTGYFIFNYQTKSIVLSKLAMRMRLTVNGETTMDSDNFISIDQQKAGK